MIKFLVKTFFYNLIIVIIVFSLLLMFEQREHWGVFGALFWGTSIFGIIAFVLLIPFAIIKYIFPDFMIIENTFMFFLLLIIKPIYDDLSFMLTDMWWFPYSSFVYMFIFFMIQCAVYILLRTYLKRKFRLIPYLVILEDCLTTKKMKTMIALLLLIMYIILESKDYYAW